MFPITDDVFLSVQFEVLVQGEVLAGKCLPRNPSLWTDKERLYEVSSWSARICLDYKTFLKIKKNKNCFLLYLLLFRSVYNKLTITLL